MPGVTARVEEVTKRYGQTLALDRVTVTFERGLITTLLGPSGCGKTTLLKIIAGIEEPDTGRVLFDGRDVTRLPPEKRNIGFVFQDLALFPHMSVYENIAFGLRVRRLPEAEIRRRVRWALELVGLDPSTFEKRRVSQLSGGQQQRVALARAIVIEPGLLLLDEPFAHLDYKIKKRLLGELRRIQRETGATVVYVTHDQEEAMSVSHRVVIMKDGRVVQVGSPEEVYDNPRDAFVASFYGEANIIRAGDGRLIVVRPENIVLWPGDSVDRRVEGVVTDVIFQGPAYRVEIRVNGYSIRALLPRGSRVPRVGERVTAGWRTEHERVVRD